MADDAEEPPTLAVLSKEVDFCRWQQSMLLYAIEKGDGDGIFTDDGSDAAAFKRPRNRSLEHASR